MQNITLQIPLPLGGIERDALVVAVQYCLKSEFAAHIRSVVVIDNFKQAGVKEQRPNRTLHKNDVVV